MTKKYDWLEKKTPRSIEQLRLWNENPRLNPEEKHITLADFTEDLIVDDNEKKQFFDLLKSIAAEYVPADPVIVWKDEESQKFYVAEGNRRVLALKLLNDPNKAPKSIRAYVMMASIFSVEELDTMWYPPQTVNAMDFGVPQHRERV